MPTCAHVCSQGHRLQLSNVLCGLTRNKLVLRTTKSRIHVDQICMPLLSKLLGCRRITFLAMSQTGSLPRLAYQQVPIVASLPQTWNCSILRRAYQPSLSQLALPQPVFPCNSSSSNVKRHQQLSRSKFSHSRPHVPCQASNQPLSSSQQPSGSSTVSTCGNPHNRGLLTCTLHMTSTLQNLLLYFQGTLHNNLQLW